MTTPADAAAHFAARLAFETDPSDVHAALEAGDASLVLLDTRDQAAWDQGHVRGALHLPKAQLASRIPEVARPDSRLVVYCWSPGCNGATRSGLILSELGYAVKEMIGGFEYWAREGLPVDRVVEVDGRRVNVDATRVPDPLTAPAARPGERLACDC